MRSGTSRGPFFLADWLPQETEQRNRLLLAIMGSPHSLQIDGLGGGNTLTSKVAIVSPSQKEGCDVDYLFAQVAVDRAIVDTHPNCGNMLAAVAPFAIEQGLVRACEDGISLVHIHNLNTGSMVQARVQTPNGKVTYGGNVAMDGVNGLAAPVALDFIDVWGKTTGHIFPNKGLRQTCINGIHTTLIDAGIPMMLLHAADFGLHGTETADDINRNNALLAQVESMRLQAGKMMGLGDVSHKVIPKPALLSIPDSASSCRAQNYLRIHSRYLTPHRCHASHSVTGAIGISTALLLPETLAHTLANPQKKYKDAEQTIDIMHPSGCLQIIARHNEKGAIVSMGVVRTVRKIMEGQFFLPPNFT